MRLKLSKKHLGNHLITAEHHRRFMQQHLETINEQLRAKFSEEYTVFWQPSDGWVLVGQTVGYTCKRVAGDGTDNWTGKRVWNTKLLRPKNVFCRKI